MLGTWVPDRVDEWCNAKVFNTHKANAKNPLTKITYYADRTGRGRVGPNYVVKHLTLVQNPMQYMESATVVQGPALGWSSSGIVTFHSQTDGPSACEIRHKSSGIVEYWKQSTVEEGPVAAPCDLAGDWVPTQVDEWVCKAERKLIRVVAGNFHERRARDPRTKLSIFLSGHSITTIGKMTGVLNVFGLVTSIAPCQWTASCYIPASALSTHGPWTCDDGKLTLSSEGVLEIAYPSASIVEFWKRSDDSGVEIHAQAIQAKLQGHSPTRTTTLAFRHFGVVNKDYFWHWALAVGDEVFEVCAGMGVMGPNGIVASNVTSLKPYCTALSQFHGCLRLDSHTTRTNYEIEQFIKEWVSTHPRYNAWGPNCQTFVEDFHVFLVGAQMPFAKFADRYHRNGGQGPEAHPDVFWNDPAYKHKLVIRPEGVAMPFKGSSECVVS